MNPPTFRTFNYDRDTLLRCDYSEVEDKGYHLVTLRAPELRPDLSDLQIDFRVSPTRRMVELHAVYEDGELRLPERLDLVELKDARVKVVVRVPKGPGLLSRELAIQSLKNIEHRKPRSLTLKRRSMVLILPPRQRKMVTNEVRAGELRITQTQP